MGSGEQPTFLREITTLENMKQCTEIWWSDSGEEQAVKVRGIQTTQQRPQECSWDTRSCTSTDLEQNRKKSNGKCWQMSPHLWLLGTDLYFTAVNTLFTRQEYKLIKTCLPENVWIMRYFRQPTLVRTVDFYKSGLNSQNSHQWIKL